MNNEIKPYNVEKKHIDIIKYLNYQKININNDLLSIIEQIYAEKHHANVDNYQITIKQFGNIKTLLQIFEDIPILNTSNDYMYYIFIILNLPRSMLKNICRFYNAELYKQYQVIPKHNYYQVMKYTDTLKLLIENLQHAKNINNENILFFIDTLNLFYLKK